MFFYAAYHYLDDWMWRDCRFREGLRYDREPALDTVEGAALLEEAAKHYGVIRNFSKIEEPSRLGKAYSLLLAIKSVDERDTASLVDTLAEELGKIYNAPSISAAPKVLRSAASKFLWIRFGSPVVIYDSKVAEWLEDAGLKRSDGYSVYFKLWSDRRQDLDDKIGEACQGLSSIKRFTLACETEEQQFLSWVNSRLFKDRVFDYYAQNEIDLRKHREAYPSPMCPALQ